MKNFVGSHHAVVDTQAVNAINTMPRDQLGETLLTGVQRATEINHHKINAACNVQELAKIDISSVNNARNRLFQDEQLNQIQLDLASLNMKFNPVNSLLAGPQLGNRNFLRTQAILHNGANQSYSRSIKRKTYAQKHRYQSKQVSQGELPDMQIDQISNHLVTEHDEQSNNTSRVPPGQEEFQGNLLLSMQKGLGQIDDDVRSELTRLSVRIARQRDDVNKDQDPVNMLQQVFRKPRVERKVGVNFLMEKYKKYEKQRNNRNVARSIDGRFQSNFSQQEENEQFSSMAQTRCTQDAQTATYQDSVIRTSGQAFNFSMHDQSQMQRRRDIQQIDHPMSAPYNFTRNKEIGRSKTNEKTDPQAGRSIVSQSMQYAPMQQKEIGVKSTLNRISHNMTIQTPGIMSRQMGSSQCSKHTINCNEDPDSVVIQPSQPTGPPSQQQLDYVEARPVIQIEIEKRQPKPSAVHSRLMGIKRLLDEKDGGQTGRKSSPDEGRGQKYEQATSQLQSWGLDNHKQMFQDNINKRKRQLDQFCQIEIPYKSKDYGEHRSRSPRLKTRETDFKTSEYNFDGQNAITLPHVDEKLSDRDLLEYLTQRILQLKMATFGANTDSINDQRRYKYKASTLHNVQPANERKRYVKLLTGEIDHFMDMLPESQETIEPQFINQSQEKSFETNRQILPEIKQHDSEKITTIAAQQNLMPVEESKMIEDENIFAFINKIQDPEQQKKLSAKERNIGLHLQQALMKLDHKFDKIEKERNKATRVSQTQCAQKQSALHNKLSQREVPGTKVKTGRNKITSKRQSRYTSISSNAEPKNSIERQLIDALSEVAVEDEALEKGAQMISQQPPSTINMDAVRKVVSAENSPSHDREINSPISNHTSGVPSKNMDLVGLMDYRENEHSKPQTTKIGIRNYQHKEKTYISKKIPVVAAHFRVINDAHVFNQYESGDMIDLKLHDLSPKQKDTLKSEAASKGGKTPVNYQKNTTEPDVGGIMMNTVDDGNDPRSSIDPENDGNHITIKVQSDVVSINPEMKSLPDTYRAINHATERSKEGLDLQRPLKIEKDSIRMSINKKIDSQTSAKSNLASDQLESKIIYQKSVEDAGTVYMEKRSPDKFVSSNIAVLTQFQPKRFNRHPRFSVQVKKGADAKTGNSNKFFQENTVNLSPEFLTILMENQQPYVAAQNKKRSPTPNQPVPTVKKADQFMNQLDEAMNRAYIEISQEGGGQELSQETGTNVDSFDKFNKDLLTTPTPKEVVSRVPVDVQNWNQHMKKNDFDPFEKVVLVKGIDNQILTSYRTLKGQNNTVSDTYKIVHRKFQAEKLASQKFYQQMKQRQNRNLPYIIENENEEMEDFPNPMDFLEVEKTQEIQHSPPKLKHTCKHHKRQSQTNDYQHSEIESNELQQSVQVTGNIIVHKADEKMKILQMPLPQDNQPGEDRIDTQRQVPSLKQNSTTVQSQTLGEPKPCRINKEKAVTLISQQLPIPQPNDSKLTQQRSPLRSESQPESLADEKTMQVDSKDQSQMPPASHLCENIYKHTSQGIEHYARKGSGKSDANDETLHSKSARHSVSSTVERNKGAQSSPRQTVQAQQQQFKHVYVNHVPNSLATQVSSRLNSRGNSRGKGVSYNPAYRSLSPVILPMNADFTQAGVKISGRAGSNDSHDKSQEDLLMRETAFLVGTADPDQSEQVIGPSGGFTPNNFFHVTKMQSLRFKVSMQRKKHEAASIIASRSLSNPRKGSTHMMVPQTVQEAQKRVIQVGETVLRSSEITLSKDESKQSPIKQKMMPHRKSQKDCETQRRLTVHKTYSSPAIDDEEYSISQMKGPAMDENKECLQDTIQSIQNDSIDAECGTLVRPRIQARITLTPPKSVANLENQSREKVVLEITTRTKVSKKSDDGKMSPEQLAEHSRQTRSPETVMRQVYEKMNTKHSVTKLIDQIYHDDRKFMSKADKDNYLNFRSPIFDLNKVHKLRTSEYFDEPETTGRFMSPKTLNSGGSPVIGTAIDPRIMDPLASMRAGKIVRLGSPPIFKEGAVAGNEMPKEESPANWYNQRRQLQKSHEKQKRDLSPEEATHQRHLTQAAGTGFTCEAASGIENEVSIHHVLEAALKFGVLPVLAADEPSPFATSRKAESFSSSPAAEMSLYREAENLLKSMPATIHEVKETEWPDQIHHMNMEEPAQERTSTQEAHRKND